MPINSNSVWDEIWDLQGELNLFVGLDTIGLGRSNEVTKKHKWLMNYCDAAANEAFEAKQNFLHKWWVKEVKDNPNRRFEISDESKVILELIDVLHFLVSAAQVMGFKSWIDVDDEDETEVPTSNAHAYNLLNDLIHCCYDDGPKQAMQCLKALFKYFKLTDEKILDFYKKKHAVNVRRQREDYAQATKTEADNNTIEAYISSTKNSQPTNDRHTGSKNVFK